MLVTNQTTSDYWFGPLHLPGGVGQQITVDDTSATSLYLTDDTVADAINNLYAAGKITVSSAADPFPRPTGLPTLLHGDGSPEGKVYAPQGSVYMRRDGVQTNGGVLYLKTTGVTLDTGWLDLATAAGTTVAFPTGTLTAFAGSTAPSGWLVCDGAAISRATYSTLFGVIGTSYGAGDGSTTFNLPDLRGRLPAGYAASGGHSDVSTLGNNDGITLANRRPKHQHTLNTSDIVSGGSTGSGKIGFGRDDGTVQNTLRVGASTNDPTDAPAYLVINYIIKT
jgi:microcystin-dependent protein